MLSAVAAPRAAFRRLVHSAAAAAAGAGSGSGSSASSRATFSWSDPLDLASQLTEEERGVQSVARGSARSSLAPRVTDAARRGVFDREIMREMGGLGLLGATISGYGCAGASYTAYGMIAREVEAVDSSYRRCAAVRCRACRLLARAVPRPRSPSLPPPAAQRALRAVVPRHAPHRRLWQRGAKVVAAAGGQK